MMTFRSVLTAVALAVGMAAPVAAENVVRWASAGGPATFDQYSWFGSPEWRAISQVYEALMYPDYYGNKGVEPRLSVEWKLVDPTTWEFKLRQGVRFHDGSQLTAEDVVFSLERVFSETSTLKEEIPTVIGAEAVNEHTVRVITNVPDIALWTKLAWIMIMPKGWLEQHGAAAPARFADGETNYATRHANGTGPFILEEFEPGKGFVLVRNPDWWGNEQSPHNIDRIVHIDIADPKARVDAVVANEIDFLSDPPLDMLDRIEATPGWKLKQSVHLRTIYLGFDQSNAELRSSNVKGENPFQDKRVRQAVYQAIDIETIHRDVMRGLSRPTGILVPPGVEGYIAELDERLPYDPEVPRALLAEAGYPGGFSVTLDCPNNRFVNDEAICHAVAAQLAEVGIDVTVNAQSRELWSKKVRNRDSDFFLEGVFAGAEGAQWVLTNIYKSEARFNPTGYANPRVDELISQLDGVMLGYGRDALIEEAWKIVLDDIVYVPLHNQVLVWAMRENFDIPLQLIDWPRFELARFKEGGGE